MIEKPLTVSQLTQRVRASLEASIGTVSVVGEVSNFRAPASGHWYFTLKDSGSTLQAVMFRHDAMRARLALRDGLSVIAHGPITVYEPRGQYQLQVTRLEMQGHGALQAQLEALKQKLQAEGLFDPTRKRPLPVFPETVGIVTSRTGAALQDFLRVLERRAPGIRIQVRDARVQGLESARQITAAIRAFNQAGEIDVLVVARGGGSLEDLWVFNDEGVARALVECRMPTISAIGHETDFTLADLVADVRAATPSAAAEMLSRSWESWRQSVEEYRRQLSHHLRVQLDQWNARLLLCRKSYALREPRRVVQNYAQKLDGMIEALQRGWAQWKAEQRSALQGNAAVFKARHPRRAIEEKRRLLRVWQERLEAISPRATLQRGYALAFDARGNLVRKAEPALVGQPIRVELAAGTLAAQVTAAQKKD